MADLTESQFNDEIDNNIKTAAGQPKTTGGKLKTLFIHVKDNLYNLVNNITVNNNDVTFDKIIRTSSIKTDDPSGDNVPVEWQLGDVFDPEYSVNISQNELIQVNLDGVNYYLPVANIVTSLNPLDEFTGVVTIDQDYTMQTGVDFVLADASQGDITVTLRAPEEVESFDITIKKIDTSGNKVFIVSQTGTVEFGNDISMKEQGETRTLRHNATNYYLK
jgi:hypothetical protein